MLLYALTIFFSSFLLFQVQPVIAKIILPWFGGSAAVWAACMLFFQVVLLLGYLYAHWSVERLGRKAQTALHLVLLGSSIVLLPIAPDASWKPANGGDPVFRILGLLGASVGLPYFLLSTTGPLLQAWYARTRRGAFPYRLFALSNLASMLALLSYPVLVEPHVSTRHQAQVWSAAYAAFAMLCAACAVLSSKTLAPVETPEEARANGGPRPGAGARLLWVALAACSSALLLAVTNHLTQNVSAIPFLWILPLTLYLLSFILVFESERWYPRRIFRLLLAAALGGMTYGLVRFDSTTNLKAVIPVFAAGLFVCSMFCHGELARRKPAARYLTSFYLMIALGGAAGGLFVGWVAPHVFRGYFELPVSVMFCALLALAVYQELPKVMYIGWAALTAVLVVMLGAQMRQGVHGARWTARNFYGGLKVEEQGDPGSAQSDRWLVHGTVIHGLQFLSAGLRGEPTTYYGRQTGVGLALEHARRSPQRVGVIGLGVGTLAAYGRPGDYYRFYEINPLVVEAAQREFSFLRDCKARVEVALGDARLSLEREPNQDFDVLAIDAFSGDSIPVHLLTREAFQLYFRHLQAEGVIAVHITNSHLDLAPVVRNIAESLGKRCMLVESGEDDAREIYSTSWALVSSRPHFFELPSLKSAETTVDPRPGLRLWTDDYSNLFQILK